MVEMMDVSMVETMAGKLADESVGEMVAVKVGWKAES